MRVEPKYPTASLGSTHFTRQGHRRSFRAKALPMPLRSFHFYSHSHEIYFPFCFRSFRSLTTGDSLELADYKFLDKI